MNLSLKQIFLHENKNNVWYHGTKSKINNFSLEYVGKGNDQEGPGIYFTSDIKDALSYGPNIISAKIELKKLVPEKGKVNKGVILKLMNTAPNYEETLTNWDENKKTAEQMLLNSILNYSSDPQETFQTVWAELYRNNPIDYLKQMIKLGYDGHIVEKSNNIKHLILYNPFAIKEKNLNENRKFSKSKK